MVQPDGDSRDLGDDGAQSTPAWGAEVYGFYPEAVKQAKAAIRELARVLLTGRPDAEFLRPVLITTLTSSLSEFVKFHQNDASEGFASPEERARVMEAALEKMQAWDAQPSNSRLSPVVGEAQEQG